MRVTNKESFRDNISLKKVGVPISYTKKQWDEYQKCANDPIYFINNHVHIINVDEGLVLFKMWPFQEELIKTIQDNRFVIAKILRQVGKTTTVVAYLLWLTLFTDSQNILIAANKKQTACDILEKYKLAYEHLPMWLQQGVDTWNDGNIKIENGCKIRAESTTSGAARSGTYNCITGDTLINIKLGEDEGYMTISDIASHISNDMQTHLTSSQDIPNQLFLDNKYYRWYKTIIQKAKDRNWSKDNSPCYTESHHIIPKSIGGDNTKENLVCLSVREHFVAHKLLTKSLTGKNKAKMVSALWMMIKGTQKEHFYFVSASDYEKIRIGHIESMKIRINNSNYVITDETRLKMSNSSFYKGKKRPPEFCKNISDKLKGHKKSEEWINKINRNPEKIAKMAAKHRGMKRSDESKARMSKAKEGYIPWNAGIKGSMSLGKKWFHNPITMHTVMINPENIPEGYISGRK